MNTTPNRTALRYPFLQFTNQDIADVMQSKLGMDGFARDKVWKGKCIHDIQAEFIRLLTIEWEDKMQTAIELAMHETSEEE